MSSAHSGSSMHAMPVLQHGLLALACLLGCLPPALGECRGDGGFACPGQDQVVPVRAGYDPADVDWNAVAADVHALTDAEPRLCTMAIRAWFHDISAHQGKIKDNELLSAQFPGLAGADGSLFTHDAETQEEQSAEHGFARVARHVLVQMASAHGASHADILTVFAGMCPKMIQGTVDIPSHCEAAGFPLFVGKRDYRRPAMFQAFNIHYSRTNQLSQPHTRIPKMYAEFLLDINDHIANEDWKLTQQDVTALMGAHGSMSYQNCMTDGEQPAEAPGIADRTCAGAGGTQRMFKWSNHYWQDITSGDCLQIDGARAGRPLLPEEDGDFTSCSWSTVEGFQLGEIMECKAFEDAKIVISDKGVRTLERELEVGVFADGWRETKWTPDPATAAPCCGFTCQTCEENPESKFWCGELGPDRFFPYGYFDCDWSAAYKKTSSYCDEPTKAGELCASQWPDKGDEIRSIMDNVPALLNKYRDSATDWERDYAIAFCKIADFGANYAPTKVSLGALFTAPSTGCLDPASVLDTKQCPDCQIPGRDPSDLLDANPIEPVAPAAAPAEQLAPGAGEPASGFEAFGPSAGAPLSDDYGAFGPEFGAPMSAYDYDYEYGTLAPLPGPESAFSGAPSGGPGDAENLDAELDRDELLRQQRYRRRWRRWFSTI